MDPEVLDLREPEDQPDAQVLSPSPRGRIAALLVFGLAIVVAVALFFSGSGEDDAAPEPTPTAAPTATPLPTPTPTPAPIPQGLAPVLDQIELTTSGAPGPLTGTIVVRHGRAPVLWDVDLGADGAELVPFADEANGARITDIVLTSPRRGVAVTRTGEYLTLEIIDGEVTVAARFDPRDALDFGLAGLSPDRRSVWLATETGLSRWRLAEGTTDTRWYDLDDDDIATPVLEGVTDVGVVVTAGGSTFLIRDGEAQPTTLQGEVLAAAGPWMVVRSCDEEFRCGRLQAEHTGDGTVIGFDEFLRWTPGCGQAAVGNDGRLLVAGERVGDASVAVVGFDGEVELFDLHPLALGCTDLTMLTDGEVILTHAAGASGLATADDSEAGATWSITTSGRDPITATAFARTSD